MTAREDQPQLGTCLRNSHAGSIHRLIVAGEFPCINWRPEDQPRPTPCHDNFGHNTEACEGLDTPSHRGEAQGEAPQPDAGQGVTYLTCGHCGKETMYDAREVMEITSKSLMETGAHPSQDAREPHDGWLNAWLYKNAPRDVETVNMFDLAVRKMAGDWADFRIKNLQAGGSTPSLPSTQTLCSADIGKISPLRFICRHGDFAEPCKDCQGTFTNCGSTPSPDPPQTLQQEHASLQQSYIHVVERAETAESDLARQKTTYLGLLDEAAKEMASLAGEIERLREALRQISDGEFATRGFSSVQSLARAILAAPDPKGE